MGPLVGLHHGLQAVGRAIGQVTRFALVVLLFVASLVAFLAASFVATAGVGQLVGGGPLVLFLLFWVFVGLIGRYVAPHVQPQIRKAIIALIDEQN